MIRSKFLSIDLDYFGCKFETFRTKHFRDEMKDSLKWMFENILKLDVPICIVDSHDEIVDFLNKFKVDLVVNVDFHSDLISEDRNIDLNEANWPCFYEHAKESNYLWIYPHKLDCIDSKLGLIQSYSSCDWEGDEPPETSYLSAKRRERFLKTAVFLEGVEAVAIVRSEDFTQSRVFREAREYLKKIKRMKNFVDIINKLY